MHAVVPYSSQQAGGAQSRTIPYRSRRFGIGSSLGYAAFEWLGSTWGLRGWSQQPPGITPMPATQPLSKRPLSHIDPSYLRIGVCLLLVFDSTYGLARPVLKPMDAGVAADVGIGVINGVLGGMTGLAGPFITIWCQLRGWSKDEQRAIFQPVILAAFVLTAMSLSVAGAINAELIKLYVYGLPFLAAGVWSGLKLYGHLDA